MKKWAISSATAAALTLTAAALSTSGAAANQPRTIGGSTVSVETDEEWDQITEDDIPYSNIPIELYDLATTISADAPQNLYGFEWVDGAETLTVYHHSDPSAIEQLIGQSGSAGSVILTETNYSRAELEQLSEQIANEGEHFGYEVSWTAPRTDGTGIIVAVTPDSVNSQGRTMVHPGEVQSVPVELVEEQQPVPASRVLDAAPYKGGADWSRATNPGFIGVCTTAFSVGRTTGSGVVTEMLTADHCGSAGNLAFTGRSTQNAFLGIRENASSGQSDIARLTGSTYSPSVYIGPRNSNTVTPVRGWVTPIVGGYVCYSGAPSGLICSNEITHTGQNIRYPGYVNTYYGLVRTTNVQGISAAGNGDSGGPALVAAQNNAYAIGIISGIAGGSTQTCQGLPGGDTRSCSVHVIFAPIERFMSNNPGYGILVPAS